MLGAMNWTVTWFRPEGADTAAAVGDVIARFLVRGVADPHAGGATRARLVAQSTGAAVMKTRLTCTVNREPVDVLADDYKTLLEVLREDLQLTGTKHGCELGECGACAVLVDGQPVLSCLVLAVESRGARSRPSRVSPRTAGCIRCRNASPTSARRSAATARPAF